MTDLEAIRKMNGNSRDWHSPADWGVPDWLIAEQYPMHTTGFAWSWDFLRRNPAYREFWTQDVVPFIGADGSIDLDASIGKYQSESSWGLFREARDRFGLMLGPLDPRSSPPIWWSFIVGRAVHEIRSTLANPTPEVSIPRDLGLYGFDFSLPLEPQFRRTLQAAKERQAYLRKMGDAANRDARLQRPEKYVLYLRLIDAEDAGAKPAGIRDELFGNITEEYPSHARSAAFKNTRAAAHRLRDGGYRSLAAI